MGKTTLPPIISKREAAKILGVWANNMKRADGTWGCGLPPSLQERGLAEAVTPLWFRDEVIEAAEKRKK